MPDAAIKVGASLGYNVRTLLKDLGLEVRCPSPLHALLPVACCTRHNCATGQYAERQGLGGTLPPPASRLPPLTMPPPPPRPPLAPPHFILSFLLHVAIVQQDSMSDDAQNPGLYAALHCNTAVCPSASPTREKSIVCACASPLQ